MKHFIMMVTLFTFFATQAISQKYFTKTAVVSFESKTPLEKIEAINKSGTCVVDFTTGNVEFAVLIKGFQFEKALMQEHFNENYIESEKYPKSTFKGTVSDISKVKLKTDGTYPVNVSGELTLHGATGKVNTKGTLTVKGGKVSGHAVFIIALADYKIEIPKLVEKNISKTIEITVRCLYDQQL